MIGNKSGTPHIARATVCAVAIVCFDALLMNFVLLSALVAIWQILIVFPLSFLKRHEQMRFQRLTNVGIYFSALVTVCVLVSVNGYIAPRRAKLLIDSIERYRRANGAYPQHLENLVPTFVDKLPNAQYTFTGQFNYYQGGNHRLYYGITRTSWIVASTTLV